MVPKKNRWFFSWEWVTSQSKMEGVPPLWKPPYGELPTAPHRPSRCPPSPGP